MDKPKKVRARITRTVEQIAVVTLDRHGLVEEIEEIIDEVDIDDIEIIDIHSVLTCHD